MKRKFTVVMLAAILGVGVGSSSLNAFDFSDWNTGSENVYGYATQVTENITFLEGADAINSDNAYPGAYSKGNTQTFVEDGTIVQDVHVKIDPAAMKHAEKFVTTLSLEDAASNYVTENVIMFQKDDRQGVIVSSNNDDKFKGVVTKAGIYTIHYEYTKTEDTILATFQLKENETVLMESVDFDMLNTLYVGDLLDAVKARSFWFVDITVANGLYVYKQLPSDSYTPPVVDKDTILDKDRIEDAILVADEKATIAVKADADVDKIMLPKEAITTAKEQGKQLEVEVKDIDGKTQYTWLFNDAIDKDINLVLNQKDAKDVPAMQDLEAIVLDFNHEGELPTGTKVKVNVSSKFAAEDLVTVSYFNEATNELEEAKEYTVDADGNIIMEIEHCSKYVVEKVVSEEPTPNPDPKPEDPTKPLDPTQPTQPTTPESKPSTAPSTGDTTKATMLLVMFGGSALSLLAISGKIKKAKK